MGSESAIARAAAVCAALIALSAGPAAAAGDPDFTGPRTLATLNGFTPAPAIDADGRAAVAVSDYAPGRSRILAYTRTRGRWARASRVLRTSRHEILEPSAAFTGDGTGVFTWLRAPRIDQEQIVEGRRLLGSGRLSRLAQLSPAGERAIFPRVVAGPGSRAIVGWETESYGLQVSEVDAAGFGAATSLFERRQFDYDLAHLPDGTVIALSQALGAGGVQVRLKPPGGGWTEAVTLSGAGRAREATVAAGADGTLAVAWAEYGGSSGYRLRLSVRRPGSGFSAARTIAPADGEARAPGLAVRDDGTVVLAWLAEAALSFLPRGSEVRVATVRADGAVSRPARVSGAGRRITQAPTVLVDAQGDALVTWEDGRRLFAATRSEAGRLSAPRLLSPSTGRIHVPRVVGNARGDALAAWSLDTGRGNRAVIQVAAARF